MSQSNPPVLEFPGSPRVIDYDSPEEQTDGEESHRRDDDTSTSEDEMAENDHRRQDSAEGSPTPPPVPASNSKHEDAETCPICLDVWSNTGDHRLVALKCGHLFGYSCILKWLNALPVRGRNCPSCKSKASIKHIRCLFARKLIAADMTEIVEMQRQIAELEAQKRKTEMCLRETQIAHKTCLVQLRDMKARAIKAENKETKDWKFKIEKRLELCNEGGCRVLCYNSRTYDFYATQKSNNPLFPGFGVRKFSAVNYTLGQFQYLHTKCIRDLSYNESRDLLASVSMDGTVRVSQCAMLGASSKLMCSGSLGVGGLWTCGWSDTSDTVLYVGGARGLLVFDLRRTTEPVQQHKYKFDPSPVVSLQVTRRGVLLCQLNTLSLLSDNDMKPIPMEGPFTNVCYDAETERVLVSCRPSSTSRARHVICKMNNDESVLDIVNTYHGTSRATVMSRSCLVSAGNSTWVAAYSESEQQLQLHGLQSAKNIKLFSNGLLDVCGVRTPDGTILATLADTKAHMFKAVPC